MLLLQEAQRLLSLRQAPRLLSLQGAQRRGNLAHTPVAFAALDNPE
jgi:hypothetical protein